MANGYNATYFDASGWVVVEVTGAVVEGRIDVVVGWLDDVVDFGVAESLPDPHPAAKSAVTMATADKRARILILRSLSEPSPFHRQPVG